MDNGKKADENMKEQPSKVIAFFSNVMAASKGLFSTEIGI